MNAEVARAERLAEVRNAAREWRAAGLIDDAAVARADALYPDDRQRSGPVFRVLLGVFTFIAGVAAFTFVAMLVDSVGVAAVVAPLVCLGVDLLVHWKKRSQGGVEEGLSLVALVLVVLALVWLLDDVLHVTGQRAFEVVLLLVVPFSFGAVWRWGMPAYAIGGAIALYLHFAQGSGGRLLWIVVPLVLAWPLLRASRSPRLAPSHRNAASGALFVSLAALYLAVNHALAEHGFIEGLSFHHIGTGTVPWCGPLTVLATALLPIAVLIVAARLRDRLGLAAGILMLLGSFITLRYYVRIAPLWVILTVAGAALILLALGLRRLLDSGPGKERAGFTAEPLLGGSNRERVLELAATLATFTPEARELPAPERPGFKPSGGSFGGGGASESF